jgi:hypothetical protein
MEISSTIEFLPSAVRGSCPYLRRFDDSHTWAAFAYPDHACHHAGKQFVSAEYQTATCLTEAHTACPVFLYEGPWPGPLPEGIGEPAQAVQPHHISLMISAAVALLVGGVVLIVLVLSLQNVSTEAEPIYQSQRTEITEITPTTGSLAPTPTRFTLPTYTPRPTRPIVVLELVFDANLRAAPDIQSALLTRLASGMHVTVLGRNSSSDWMLITTDDGQQGWIAGTQADHTRDLSSVPVVSSNIISASAIIFATIQPSPTIRSGATATQPAELPDDFEIVMALEPSTSTCNIGDYESLYRFQIGITHITITGLGPDTTMIDGSYNSATGDFAAAGGIAVGFDTMRGTITFDRTIIIISASRTITYHKQQCSGTWTLYGTTEVW